MAAGIGLEKRKTNATQDDAPSGPTRSWRRLRHSDNLRSRSLSSHPGSNDEEDVREKAFGCASVCTRIRFHRSRRQDQFPFFKWSPELPERKRSWFVHFDSGRLGSSQERNKRYYGPISEWGIPKHYHRTCQQPPYHYSYSRFVHFFCRWDQ